MFVFNNNEELFKVGDIVWIANTVTAFDTAYDATILKVLSNEETKFLGVHYVLLVSTHIYDYITVREHERCFCSKEHYEEVKAALKDRKKL